MNYKLITCLVFLSVLVGVRSQSQAQELPQVNITFISENISKVSDPRDLETAIQNEVQVLLRNRFQVSFKTRYGAFNTDKMQEDIQAAFQDDETDIIISTGAISSALIAKQKSYPKPTIASIILDQQLQEIKQTQEGASGIENFTYLESPFNIKRDLEKLYRIFPFKKVGFMGSRYITELLPFNVEQYFANLLQGLGADYVLIPYENTPELSLDNIPEDVDAIYFIPAFGQLSDADEQELVDGVNELGLGSASLVGDDFVAKGSLLGYESSDNLNLIPRRIALNILKIAEGDSAAALNVHVPTYTETLLINMKTARKINKYPDFDLMAESILISLNEVQNARTLSLEGAIAEALKNNLNVKIAEKNVTIAEKDVSIARTDYMPQASVSSTLSIVDKNTAQNSFGAQGRANLSVAGNLSQVILSEPVIANIAIQKFLQEGEKQALRIEQLDVVLDAATAYLNVIQSLTIIRIRQDNVLVTKENYDIARAKEAVGYSGATDINRFQAELAQNNIALNNAQAQYKQAAFLLNQRINRPINEEFNITELDPGEAFDKIIDNRIIELIDNYGDLDQYTNFLVEEGKRRLPEFKQIQANIRATERQRKSQFRRFYLPSLNMQATTNYVVERWNIIPSPLLADFPGGSAGFAPNQTWNIGFSLQYPLFLGDSRRRQVQRTDLSLLQLRDQESLLFQQLELSVRSAMETTSASFSRVRLSREAADAAAKNFEIIRDSYSQGLSNITTLVDAQNVSLQTSLEAENAVYQFMIDLLNTERLVGFYHLTASAEEKDDFYERLNQYLTIQE